MLVHPAKAQTGRSQFTNSGLPNSAGLSSPSATTPCSSTPPTCTVTPTSTPSCQPPWRSPPTSLPCYCCSTAPGTSASPPHSSWVASSSSACTSSPLVSARQAALEDGQSVSDHQSHFAAILIHFRSTINASDIKSSHFFCCSLRVRGETMFASIDCSPNVLL